MNSKIIKAIFLQFSGILGAGIFVLPYIFSQNSFFTSTALLTVFAILLMTINLFYIKIILNTRGDHQLSGYAHIYLGPKFKLLSTAILFLSGFGAIIAYIKLASNFLNILLPSFLNYSVLLIIFLLAIFHFSKNKLNFLSQIIPILSLLFVIFLFIFSLNYSLPVMNIGSFNFSYLGALIFALTGFSIIPEVEETLRGSSQKRQQLIIASVLGLMLAVIIYFLFSYSIIRISGSLVSTDSISGLFEVSPFLGKILAAFGLVTIIKSSLNFLLIFKEVFYRDLKLSSNNSYLLAFIFPLLALLFFNVSFIEIISLTGSITISLSALIIYLIYFKLPKLV